MQAKREPCGRCGQTLPVWKRIDRVPHCQGCAPKKGFSPSKSSGAAPSTTFATRSDLPRQKPLAHSSKKQAAANQAYSALRRVFLSKPENQTCRAGLPACTGQVTDVHHMRGRGKYLLLTETWIGVCRNCHETIEQSPELAKELGLSKSRLHEND